MIQDIHLSTIAWSLYNELAVLNRGPATLEHIQAGLAGRWGEPSMRELRAAARALEQLGMVTLTGSVVDCTDPRRRPLISRDRRMNGRRRDGWRNWVMGVPRQIETYQRVTEP